jgi:hypothetical protein
LERKLPTDCVSSTNFAFSTLAISTAVGFAGPPAAGLPAAGAAEPPALVGVATGLAPVAAISVAVEVGLCCSHQAAPEAAATPTRAIARYGFLKDINVSERDLKQF